MYTALVEVSQQAARLKYHVVMARVLVKRREGREEGEEEEEAEESLMLSAWHWGVKADDGGWRGEGDDDGQTGRAISVWVFSRRKHGWPEQGLLLCV